MKKITIYSTRICPYCVRAKNFFDKKNIEYTEIMIDKDPSLISEMVENQDDNLCRKYLLMIIMLEDLMTLSNMTWMVS